jgi:SAM-dependent methyltransferase
MPAARQLPLRHRLRRVTRPAFLGTLRSSGPLSDNFGFDRGTPVDRYYIERFLYDNRADIRGHVLEVKDSAYTDRFGTGVTRRDVLDIEASNPDATVVADLAACAAIEDASFDCFVLTQTLQFIRDAPAAIAHARRILKPGGVLLVTVPAVSPVAGGRVVDYWRFTVASCIALFGEVFGREAIAVRSHGSFLTCVAFLAGMAREELTEHELEQHDGRFALLISVRASRA